MAEPRPHKDKKLCHTYTAAAGQACQLKQRVGCDNAVWAGSHQREAQAHSTQKLRDQICGELAKPFIKGSTS